MTKEQEAERGRVIAGFLENEHVAALFASVEAKYIGEIRGSEPTESTKREAAYHSLRALSDLRSAMAEVVNSGKFADAQLRRT